MIKNQIIYEIKKGERTYTLMFEQNAPAGEVFDVGCEIKAFAFNVIKEAQEAEKTKQEETSKE